MNNSELLQELQAKIASGKLSKAAVYKALGEATEAEAHGNSSSFNFTITRLLYSIGGVVACLGVVALYAQIWDDLSTAMRIVSTLGLGLVFAGVGSHFLLNTEQKMFGAVMHALGGVVIPTGVVVTLIELGNGDPSALTFAGIFGCLALFYLALTWLLKHPVLTFFTLANATGFVYTMLTHLLRDATYTTEETLWAYTTLVLGISYLLLTFNFKKNWNEPLTGLLYLFGSNFILWGGFFLIFKQVLWEFGYVLVPLGMMYGAIKLQSKTIMFSSTVALIAYISYLTGEYFANSIGWPISLVFLGFVFIALGYWSVRLTKEYIK